MSNTYLFHVEVFMPARYRRPIFEGRLRYGEHALRASQDDRYGRIELPELFDASQAHIIEAEYDVDRDQVIKQVWRQKLDSERDLILVIGRGGFVRTVWVNLKTDKHKTLNPARYVRA